GRWRPPTSPRERRHDRRAPLAQRRVRAGLAHAGAPGPAPLALLPAERLGGHPLEHEAGNVLALVPHPPPARPPGEPRARDVAHGGEQRLAFGLEQRAPLLLGRARHVEDRVDPLADLALLARDLERARDLTPPLEQALPVGGEPLVDPLAALLR